MRASFAFIYSSFIVKQICVKGCATLYQLVPLITLLDFWITTDFLNSETFSIWHYGFNVHQLKTEYVVRLELYKDLGKENKKEERFEVLLGSDNNIDFLRHFMKN